MGWWEKVHTSVWLGFNVPISAVARVRISGKWQISNVWPCLESRQFKGGGLVLEPKFHAIEHVSKVLRVFPPLMAISGVQIPHFETESHFNEKLGNHHSIPRSVGTAGLWEVGPTISWSASSLWSLHFVGVNIFDVLVDLPSEFDPVVWLHDWTLHVHGVFPSSTRDKRPGMAAKSGQS